jgi:hypothetical protein
MNDIEKVRKIINEISDSSNSELLFALKFLNEDYEQTKKQIIDLTKRLDNLEIVYNKILKEQEKRYNVNR